ncbi:hypothetical protein [Streptomyces xanthii]|uniref:Uncharacterized protein n=1 Tax=Streptomyces xanthii TaxID=2768069 RepID=A0A7H1B3L2_9ACTN|nr:hypothetical protein [Streptomyces xanthii]QNS03317.1 hypothetical protein IAG42_06530 [Streptomyces xanthii]
MKGKQAGLVAATVAVLVWSIVLVALGQVAAVATLAPALGLTIQQIVQASRGDHTRARAELGAALHDKEGHAP